MNEELNKKELEEVDDLFRLLGEVDAPNGLENRIMKAVETEHSYQKTIQKNIRRATIGVVITVVSLIAFVILAYVVPSETSTKFQSSVFVSSLVITGLLFLFLELEMLSSYLFKKTK